MAGIGRPKGSRKIPAVRMDAINTLAAWKAAHGFPSLVSEHVAYGLTGGMVGKEDSTEMVSLAYVALTFETMKRKANRCR